MTGPHPASQLEPYGVGHDAIVVLDLAWADVTAEDVPEVPADFAERLVRRFLTLCESPRTREAMLAMVRGSVSSSRLGRRFYRLLSQVVVHPAARAGGIHASALRYELVASQLIGVAMMRYVLEVEPVASLPVDDLVRQLAPGVRATLVGVPSSP